MRGFDMTDEMLFSQLMDEENEGVFPVISMEEDEDLHKLSLPEVLPVLTLRGAVMFPGVVMPITIGRERSIRLMRDAYANDKYIATVAQTDARLDNPTWADVYQVGTAARILRILEMPDGSTTAILQGIKRIRLAEHVSEDPYFVARIEIIPEVNSFLDPSKDVEMLISTVKDVAMSVLRLSANLAQESMFALKNIESKTFLINYISANLEMETAERQHLLESHSMEERAQNLLEQLLLQRKELEVKNEIQDKAKGDIEKQNREYFLNLQMKAIQDELGGTPAEQEIRELKEKASKKKWSESVARVFEKEISKLEKMNPASAEYPIQQTYLQTLIDLPWDQATQDNLDLKQATDVLNEDHFGLEKVKERIIEHLAVLKLRGDLKSPILCLYGPPGVGKTSLGKSVARALNRNYARIALGGLHDESEIRGHRKTYIGAMPGRIIQNIKKCGSSNPVIVLDEVDKVGNDFRGDPSSALLEVLDPEQNNAFHDNYIELDYDLSQVLFIATANNVSAIQPALRDRMEMISISGYIIEEKKEIAQRHLIPKQKEANGLKEDEIGFSDAALTVLIEEYTREAGVRGLEKAIAKMMRHLVKLRVMDQPYPTTIEPDLVREIMGVPIFQRDKIMDDHAVGVVTGLAWTESGGDVLFVETSLSKGAGTLTITGNLGDVMKESASIAWSYLKSHAAEWGIDVALIEKNNLHVHVPEGAIPKDGPSAGITLLTAIASVYTGRKVRKSMAMTGEMTLRGKVLPVGGIREKMLAAKRSGTSDVLLCIDNKKDIEDIPAMYLEGLNFHYVTTVDEVLRLALLPYNA